MTFKEFLLLEENKKAYWQALNWFMAFAVSYLTYLAGDNVAWAVTSLPIARIIAEMLTRYFNKEKAFGAFRK